MGFIASVAIVLVVLGAADVIKLSSGTIAIILLVGVLALICFGVSEAGKDAAAYKNRRDYWLKRGSGVRDRRTYDDRYKRRR